MTDIIDIETHRTVANVSGGGKGRERYREKCPFFRKLLHTQYLMTRWYQIVVSYVVYPVTGLHSSRGNSSTYINRMEQHNPNGSNGKTYM